jgi:myosin V
MAQLHTMEPHYVRCVKPNGANAPGLFENSNALHQLRCGGAHARVCAVVQTCAEMYVRLRLRSAAQLSAHLLHVPTWCHFRVCVTGVLEAVRISCAGFPAKRPFPDFIDHFWQLAPELYHREDLDDR